MVNINWKPVVGAKYSTRCHKDYTKVVDVLRHSDLWSQFIMEIVGQAFLLDWVNSFSLKKNVEIQIFYITIAALNIDSYMKSKEFKHWNAFGHISHGANRTIHTGTQAHTHTYTHTHTHMHIIYIYIYIYIYTNGFNESNKLRSLTLCPLHHLSITLSLSLIQIIFCLGPFTKSHSMNTSSMFWKWTIHILC